MAKIVQNQHQISNGVILNDFLQITPMTLITPEETHRIEYQIQTSFQIVLMYKNKNVQL